jgi:ABC-2 type transport system permease protein
MQLMLFGYAINTDVRHIPMLVVDHDASAASRDLARSLQATGAFDLVGEAHGDGEIAEALRAGRARVALVVPARFDSDLKRGKPTVGAAGGRRV